MGLTENKILSICIPTFNREEYLKKCLDSILPQVIEFKDKIDVFISDNASTDNTRTLINSYLEKYEFKYHRNDVNVGGALNVISCYEEATSKYVWIFSDDDYLFDGALKKIISLLEQSPQILFLNSLWYSNPLAPEKTVINPEVVVSEFNSGIDYVKRVSFWVTFLTSNIVLKSVVNGEIDAGRYKNTLLPQLGWILPGSFSDGKKLIVEDQIIACKSGNTQGYKIGHVFGHSLNSILDDFIFRGVSREFKHIINRELLKLFFPNFVSSANWTWQEKLAMLRTFWPYKEYWSIYILPKLRLHLLS